MLTYKIPALADTIFKPDTTTGHQTRSSKMNSRKAAYLAARGAYQDALTWRPVSKTKFAQIKAAYNAAWAAYKAA